MPKIITGYNLPLLTVESLLGSSLYCYYDASDESQLTLSGNNVLAFNDKSGRNNHLTSSANSPTYDNINKKINFNGVDNYLVKVDGARYPTGAPSAKMLIIGGQSLSGDANNYAGQVLCQTQGQLSIRAGFSGVDNILTFYTGLDTSQANSSNSTNEFLIIVRYITNLGATSVRVNGQAATTTVSTPARTISFRNDRAYYYYLGAITSSSTPEIPTNFWNGSLRWMIATSSNPSDANCQKIEGIYAYKFNLQSILPSDHPYKIFPPTL